MSSDGSVALAALCRTHPVRPKIVFVSSGAVGQALEAGLIRRGVQALNLRFVVPEAWARRHVGVQLAATGWRPLDALDGVGWAAAWLDAAPEARDRLFGASASSGQAEALYRTLTALRMDNVTDAAVQRSALPDATRAPLAEALAAFQEWMEKVQRYDAARLFAEGAAHPQGPENARVAVLEATPWPSRVARYVQALAAHAGASCMRLEGPHADDAAAAARLCLRTAPGAWAEVRGLLRDIRRRGLALGDVEVAYTAPERYLPLLDATLRRFAVPATVSAGRPARHTRTGQALAGFLRWIGQGFPTNELAALCRAELLDFGAGGPPAYRVAAVLERGGAGQGRTRHRTLIARRMAAHDAGADRTQHLSRVQAALDALVALVPTASEAPAQALVQAARRFLDRFAPSGAAEATVRDELDALLRTLAATATDTARSVPRLAHRLQHRVAAHPVEAGGPHPDKLHVAPLEQAGYTGRPHRYVIGLDDDSFPVKAAADTLLDPVEWEALGVPLPDPGAAAHGPLLRLLQAPAETLTLTARTEDLVRGTAVAPIARFQKMAVQHGVDEEDGPRIPRFSLVPQAPDEGLDRAEQLLAGRGRPGFAARMREEAPWLARGQDAARARTDAALTRFDGWLGHPTPELAIANGYTPVSASQLETLAACPFRYFLRHVLEIEPPERPDEDPARWLDPQQFGALLHELYRAFMAALDEDASPGPQHEEPLMQMLAAKIDAYRERVPVEHEAAFRADRARLRRAARIFLSAEAARSEAVPFGFEISFGRGTQGAGHRPEPVAVRLTDDVRLQLRGQIDRVDRRPDGDFELWDYKSGSMRPYDPQDLGRDGQHLQWALYAYAFEAMQDATGRDGRVVRSGYFFANDREHGRRIAQAPPPRAALGAQLRPLLQLVAHGGFVHGHRQRGACRFCAYRRICANEAKTARDLQAACDAADTDDPAHVALRQWLHA